MLERKLALARVARVSLAEYRMPVAGNNLTGSQCLPQVVFNLLIGCASTNVCLHLLDPAEYFLVGETMERTGKTIESSRKGEVWVRKGTSNKVCCVCAFVIIFFFLKIKKNNLKKEHQNTDIFNNKISNYIT